MVNCNTILIMIEILIRNIKTVGYLYLVASVLWYLAFGFSQMAFKVLTLGAVGIFVWYFLFDLGLIIFRKKKYWE